MSKLCLNVLFTLVICLISNDVWSKPSINLAVASNFLPVMKQLADRFEQQSDIHVNLSSGSSGKLFAQIQHGAPFDIFLSADTDKPARLINDGFGLDSPVSPFVYARGKLVLWAPSGRPMDRLTTEQFQHLAIANPKLAPYGHAAQQTLTTMKLNGTVASRLVSGENINQTFRFISTGAADLGFVAMSQVINQKVDSSEYWTVPDSYHQPIEQGAVLLSRAKDNPHALAFFSYLSSEQAQRIIRNNGYW